MPVSGSATALASGSGHVCSASLAQQSNLLDLFESAMKSIATTLARAATFDTTDFATAKQRNCEGFQLQIKRVYIDERNTWHGEFRKAEQHLSVLGSLG